MGTGRRREVRLVVPAEEHPASPKRTPMLSPVPVVTLAHLRLIGEDDPTLTTADLLWGSGN